MEAIDHSALLEQFESYLVDEALAPATVINYLADLRAFLRWIRRAKGPGHSPFTLDEGDLQAYCTYLGEARSHVAATVNRRLQALRKFYDFAILQGWTAANPASDVPLLSEVASERTRSLTSADVSRLLAAARRGPPRRANRDVAILQVLAAAGLKLNELTQLRLADVHLDEGTPHLTICNGSAERDRTVPLESEVYNALHAYLSTRKAAPGVEYLFVNRDGNLLSTRSVQRLLRRYAHAAGLDNLTTQALRYVYARKIYQKNGDLRAVARLLGHRHLATTIRYLRPCLPQEK